jgi:TetR/AcrR family transcriptional regulator
MKTEKMNQSKEEAILQAAEHEFFTRGYDGARTTSIAKAAGVTHAMLHYYFKTKENLFEKIVGGKIKTIGNLFLVAFSSANLPFAKKLEEGITAQFEFILKNPDLPRFFVNEIASKPEHYKLLGLNKEIRSMVKNILKNVQTELDKENASRKLPHMDARHLMLDIVSLNVFPFIAYPVIQMILGKEFTSIKHFAAARKAENIKTIMKRLK